MDDGKITRLCPHCESPVERDECADAACPLGHREYPPTTADELIPSLSPPGNDAGSHRAAMLARVADMVRSAQLAAKAPAPPITDPAWLEAEGWAQVASLLILAEAWLVEHWPEHDPDVLKQASAAICGGLDWSAEAGQPSHATLAQRRSQAVYPPGHQR